MVKGYGGIGALWDYCVKNVLRCAHGLGGATAGGSGIGGRGPWGKYGWGLLMSQEVPCEIDEACKAVGWVDVVLDDVVTPS